MRSWWKRHVQMGAWQTCLMCSASPAVFEGMCSSHAPEAMVWTACTCTREQPGCILSTFCRSVHTRPALGVQIAGQMSVQLTHQHCMLLAAGPGLAVRVLGDVTEGNALEVLRQVCLATAVLHALPCHAHPRLCSDYSLSAHRKRMMPSDVRQMVASNVACTFSSNLLAKVYVQTITSRSSCVST